MKCCIEDCENTDVEEIFIGQLCFPCWEYIVCNREGFSQAYKNDQEVLQRIEHMGCILDAVL